MSNGGKFQKRLRLFDATAIVTGSMIGSGIFIVSADIARNVGAPGWLLMVWLVTGILTVIAALTYGELSSLMPHAGGQYVFLKESYNPLIGFLYGWAAFLVIQGGTIAAVAMGFAKFSGVLFPWISQNNVWFSWRFLNFSTVHLVAIGSIIVLTILNTHGILFGKVIQNMFTTTKVGILLIFIVIGLFIARNGDAVHLNKTVFWSASSAGNDTGILTGIALLIAFTTAMVGSLFSSDAWNNITFASDEVINPRRNLPLSLVYGTVIVSLIYFLVNIAYLQALPLRGSETGLNAVERGIQFAAEDRVATAAMEGILGQNAAIFMAILVMISTFGCNNGIILASARVYYAMAVDGVFFKQAGRLNSKGVPARALVIQGIYTSILCLSGTYSDLLDYVVFTVLLFYILTILSVFILRRKYPDMERPYRAPGFPVLPVLYIVLVLFIMVILLIYKQKYTWPGLIIVLLGIPVYYIWRKRGVKENGA
ncbi:MAG TPA: amino acid permease [Bacteroidales bacterium]|jgi:APA family basic amino acid/polyamine antiporter|nr:amino acid permease [Bacteroidales bacterium]